jgi:hypothetical protein
MNVSALAGSSRTAVRDAAGDAAQGTAHTKERILELPEAAVLETGFGATVCLALKSRSMLGLSFTTGKGQAQSRGASFR